MLEISRKTTEHIYSYVKKDLQPTLGAVVWRVALSLAVGGGLSLLFCGQFGIGFSEMALRWNHLVHNKMGALQCAVVCGAAYVIVPILLLRLLCSPLLFRKIIRGYGLLQACLLSLVGIAMYTKGSFMNELAYIAIWTVSAYITYKLLGRIVDQMQTLVLTFANHEVSVRK